MLVIIGLLAGGTLVGIDLIKAATIRATINQKRSYDVAVYTFKGKYNNMPGDITPAKAAAFGFTAFTGANAGTRYYGDANDIVDGWCTGLEALMFWKHLSEANLITGNYGDPIDTATGMTSNAIIALPKAKLGGNRYFMVSDSVPVMGAGMIYSNFYNIYPAVATNCGGPGYGVTPLEAFAIDSKLDDGLPTSGIVLGLGNSGTQAGACHFSPVMLGDPDISHYVYNTPLDNNRGNTLSCHLEIKFQ